MLMQAIQLQSTTFAIDSPAVRKGVLGRELYSFYARTSVTQLLSFGARIM